MKSLKLMSATVFTLLLISGCSSNQPEFDPNHTEVQTVDGKSYNIPLGASPSPYVDAKVIKFYQEIGLTNCQEGDITWEEQNAISEMGDAIAKGDKGIYHKLAKEGRIGCASPISSK
jgi:PBP1b-binding outer membrane lipoprotein LpoB